MPVLMESDDRTGVGWKANRDGRLAERLLGSWQGMFRFTTRVVVEGAKSAGELRSRRITVPAAVVRELRATGAHLPGWLRASLDGGEPLFVFGRRPKSRSSVDVVLPSWRFGKLPSGTLVDVALESAEPFRAVPGNGQRFDWLDYLSRRRRYFPSQAGEALTISYRRDPISLVRCPDEAAVYWLLGFYQAEGAKRSSSEWSVVSSNPHILRAVRVLLTDKLGVSPERLYLDVLHAPKDDPDGARQEFEDVGARIAHVRARTPHKKWKSSGGRGAVLHAEKSIVFYRLVMAALRRVFRKGFPSQIAARSFALGWLEGDGGLSSGSSVTRLGMYGTRREVALVLMALHTGFGWDSKGGRHVGYTRVRSLTAPEAYNLTRAGAFAYSMNRARLLYAVEGRSRTVRDVYARVGARSFAGLVGIPHIVLLALLRPGLLVRAAGEFRLTNTAVRLCEGFPSLLPEIEALRQVCPPAHLGVTGVKSAPYPKELLKFGAQIKKAPDPLSRTRGFLSS